MRALLAILLMTAAARAAGAGMLAACDEPAGFAGPVQLFVLQYGFEPSAVDADPRLVETARRLSYLIQLDVLANDSYGSIASILLQEEQPGRCLAGEVQDRLLGSGALQPGQAVALVWGRIYREGDAVLVQSYLRFLRVDPDELRFADERFAVALSDPPVRLEGSLPTQSIAFAPRRLSAERLDAIDADWRDAARLYDRPEVSASGRELPPADERFAYFVREMTADGWLGVELSQGAGRGWLKADPEVRRSLRALLPELDFVEGVIGYLSYRQAADGRGFPAPPAPWMLERIKQGFWDSGFLKPPGEPQTLALTLLGTLQAFETPDQTAVGLESLREALRQQPEDGRLRNLVAMAELRQCCAESDTNSALKRVPTMLLAGLAVDPNNADLLANLQTTYAWLAGEPAGTATVALATGLVRVNAKLRAAPGIAAPAIGLARGGSRIRVTGTDPSGQWLRVDRGAAPDGFVAARLVQDLEPSGMECGRDVSSATCEALRSGPQGTQGFAALFRTLEQARARNVQASSARLAAAGLTAAEVGARLMAIKELRQALGEPN